MKDTNKYKVYHQKCRLLPPLPPHLFKLRPCLQTHHPHRKLSMGAEEDLKEVKASTHSFPATLPPRLSSPPRSLPPRTSRLSSYQYFNSLQANNSPVLCPSRLQTFLLSLRKKFRKCKVWENLSINLFKRSSSFDPCTRYRLRITC